MRLLFLLLFIFSIVYTFSAQKDYQQANDVGEIINITDGICPPCKTDKAKTENESKTLKSRTIPSLAEDSECSAEEQEEVDTEFCEDDEDRDKYFMATPQSNCTCQNHHELVNITLGDNSMLFCCVSECNEKSGRRGLFTMLMVRFVRKAAKYIVKQIVKRMISKTFDVIVSNVGDKQRMGGNPNPIPITTKAKNNKETQIVSTTKAVETTSVENFEGRCEF